MGNAFNTFAQTTAVSPPVDGWTYGQQSYEISPHFNILTSPAASSYGTFGSQYSTFDTPLFPTIRQHYDYSSPSRDQDDLHHKTEHYTSMDQKYEHCNGSTDG